MTEQFQRTHSVLYICCIELWTKAVLSSDPAFLRNIVVLRDPTLNPVIITGQIGRIAANESHRNRWKRIIKSLGYSKNIRICICNSYEAAINLLSTGINKLWRYCRHFEFGNVTWSRDDQSDIFRRWNLSIIFVFQAIRIRIRYE